MKQTLGEKIGNIFLGLFLILLCAVTLYPFVNSFLLSVSPLGLDLSIGLEKSLGRMNWNAWRGIVGSSYMWRGFYNSVIRTVLGTAIAVTLMSMMAYPLSKKEFVGCKFFNTLIVISMTVGAGMIPSYILMKNLRLMDTLAVLVLPGAIAPFSVIILRNFFTSIPDSMAESAKIDGANDFLIFFKIILPLSLPSVATITLWCAVGHWNSWFDVVLYINSREKYLLPAILRELVVNNSVDKSFQETAGGAIVPNTESMQAAATLFTTIPILIVYPFLQKHFAKGVMVGAVKG